METAKARIILPPRATPKTSLVTVASAASLRECRVMFKVSLHRRLLPLQRPLPFAPQAINDILYDVQFLRE
jgi:hypothetical protein